MSKQNLVCPHCNQTFLQWVDSPLVFGCPACGQISEMANGSLHKAAGLSKRVKGYAPGWLRPGVRLIWAKKEYRVAGLFQYATNWSEWDSEDNAWSSGRSDSWEWYAFAADGSELNIEYDDGAHFIRTNAKPPDALAIERLKSSDRNNLIEEGDFQLIAFIGQDDEALDRRKFQYKVLDSQGDLTAEWENGKYDETVSYYRCIPLSFAQLRQMRVVEPEEAAAMRMSPAYQQTNLLRRSFGVVSMIFLGLVLSTFIFRKPAIFSGSAPFSSRQIDSSMVRTRSLGSFHVEKGKNYRFETACYFEGSNKSAELLLELVKLPDGKPVNAFECSFYTESGYDDEGHWTESQLSDDFYFHATEDADYEAFIMPDAQAGSIAADVSGSLQVRVLPLSLSRFYLIGFLLTALCWLIYQWRTEAMQIKSGIKKYGAVLHEITGR